MRDINSVNGHDFRLYILNADRDDVGVHHIPNEDHWTIHIYNGRLQANICHDGNPVINIVFLMRDGVTYAMNVYEVHNGVCDYSHPLKVSDMYAHLNDGEWVSKYLHGRAVCDAILAAMQTEPDLWVN